MEDAGFEIADVEGLRPHYALTLRAWVRRLERRHARALEYVNEATYRVWRLYMAASALEFESGNLGIYQILARKRGAEILRTAAHPAPFVHGGRGGANEVPLLLRPAFNPLRFSLPPVRVSEEERCNMIARAAYFRAERRHFAPGQELEDWVAAEADVDRELAARGLR